MEALRPRSSVSGWKGFGKIESFCSSNQFVFYAERASKAGISKNVSSSAQASGSEKCFDFNSVISGPISCSDREQSRDAHQNARARSCRNRAAETH